MLYLPLRVNKKHKRTARFENRAVDLARQVAILYGLKKCLKKKKDVIFLTDIL